MLIGLMGNVCVAFALLFTLPVQADTMTLWDFNHFDGDARRIKAAGGEAAIVLDEAWTDQSIANPAGSRLNAVGSEEAGRALSLAGMARNGRRFELFLPMEGAVETRVSAAVRRSGTGFTTLRLAVSTDGGKTFTDNSLWSIGETWAIHKTDLTPSEPSSQLILRFEVDGASSSRGTLLLDNLRISCGPAGKRMPEE